MDYTEIPGWCNFENLYEEQVARIPVGGIIVEVGTWRGRSTALMGKLLKASGKTIAFYAIDNFVGDASLDYTAPYYEQLDWPRCAPAAWMT